MSDCIVRLDTNTEDVHEDREEDVHSSRKAGDDETKDAGGTHKEDNELACSDPLGP